MLLSTSTNISRCQMRVDEVHALIEELRRELDAEDELREKTLKLTREVVRLSGDAVRALHRGDMATAREKIDEGMKKVSEIREMLRDHGNIYFTGYVQTAHQELVEAVLLYSYLKGERAPSHRELGIPAADYVLGIGDFIGELRRHFLITLMEGDLEKAEKVFRFMESVYSDLMMLDYPKGLVNVRQKQDQARKTVERTLEDITRAKLERELEDKLKSVLGRIGGS